MHIMKVDTMKVLTMAIGWYCKDVIREGGLFRDYHSD